MKCIFTPGLYSGNKKTDEQHIALFSMADTMIKAIEKKVSKQELLKYASDFAEYVAFHTADEEAFMRQEGYPKWYEHQKLHSIINEKAQNIVLLFAKTDDVEELSFIVLEFVVDFVLEHIKRYDLEMVEYFNIRSNMNSML